VPNADRFGESAGGDVPLWVTRYTPDHTRLVRTKLQIEGRARDLALFNLVMASFAAVTFVIRIEGVAAWGTRQLGQPSGKRNGTACQI
jgi:hypothetical protein